MNPNRTNASGHEENGSGGLRGSGSGGVGSTEGGSGGGRGPFNPFNQRGEQTVSIDLDSSSSSVTDVGEEDWQSIRRLSEPPAPLRPAFTTNPIAFMRSLVAPNSSSNAASRQQDLELSSYYKSNHPVVKHQVQMEKEMMEDCQPSTPATLNGRRRLSLAFLQDMVPMENEDHIPMGVFMGSHLDRALRLSHAQSSKITLGFLNEDVEADYRSYFWSTIKKRWSLFIGIGGSIAIAVQVAGLLGKSGDGLSGATTSDWGVLAGAAILPIVLIASLPFILKDAIMARHVHLISLAFLLLIGPVMTCIRYTNKHLLSPDSVDAFNPSVTAPIYIVGLIASVFFLRLRFVHTICATIVAAPTWYAVLVWTATESAQKDAFILNSIVLLFACFVTCFIAFDLERSLRHQYLSNSRFLSITKNLQSQLDGLERSLLYSAASRNGIPTADLSSPLERAMLAIRGLMADTMTPVDHLGVLELIMACLSSPNLLTPDLDVQVKEGNVAIDDEQEKWLFHEVATRNANRGAGAGLEQIAQFETFKFGDSEYQPSGDALSLVEVDVDTRRPSAAVSTFGTPTSVISIQNFEAIFHSAETRNLLVRVPEFNFPIFDFVKSTDNHSLLVLGHHLIEESGLLNNLGLDSFKFNNFLATIEGGYHADLAFHNSVHATDVLHCINYMVQLPTIRSIFTDLEMLSLYVAAIIHDFDHPGVSNSFLIATADRRALLYNDKAVLENHHCASAFEVLARKECSFLSTLDRADYKSVRENVVDMVLATDLAQHFTLLTNFKKKVLTGDTFDPLGTREDRTLLMQMLMKCSDVSNPTKAWPEYSIWIDRIHEEWYAQGDMEKARGLPFSPFCNRDGPHATNPASSQTGFINFIVSPLFEAFSAWTPIDEIWQGLEHNKNRWAEASPEAAQQSPAKKLSIKPSPLTMPTSPKSSFKSPMRLKSVGPIFSPTSPSTPFHGNSAAVKMKVSRSKSTTHAPVYLSAVASDSSLSPLVPDGAHMGRRGSDSRDASK